MGGTWKFGMDKTYCPLVGRKVLDLVLIGTRSNVSNIPIYITL